MSTKRVVLTLPDDTPEAALVRSVAISDALQSCVGRLTASPAFVVAKGGITSSDVGVKALRVKCAKVLGQIRPGIPVWQTGAESLFPARRTLSSRAMWAKCPPCGKRWKFYWADTLMI